MKEETKEKYGIFNSGDKNDCNSLQLPITYYEL